MKTKKIFSGILSSGNRLFTQNLLPGNKTFAKSLVKISSQEFREWNPYRSKAAGAIIRGIKNFPIKAGSKTLYLAISEYPPAQQPPSSLTSLAPAVLSTESKSQNAP
jgi:fibrillarin-like rRNA methylase